jgi:alpha-tubulin suppressor-like RCC1 family protein
MHTCVRLTSGGVMCFGAGDDGRLGYGDTEDVGDDETPLAQGLVPIGESVVEIACGGRHTCARLESGDIKCWGDNDFGQLGDGTTQVKGDTLETVPEKLPPVAVDESVLTLGAGLEHTCAVLVTGRFKCWGDGTEGRLATGSDDEVWMPALRAVAVDPVLSATSIDGGDRHTCARVTDGTVRCWGASGVGQTGYGSTQSLGDEPGETPDLNGPVPL